MFEERRVRLRRVGLLAVASLTEDLLETKSYLFSLCLRSFIIDFILRTVNLYDIGNSLYSFRNSVI